MAFGYQGCGLLLVVLIPEDETHLTFNLSDPLKVTFCLCQEVLKPEEQIQ